MFYLIFFSVYGLANLYLYWALGKMFPTGSLAHRGFSITFITLALCFFAGRIFSRFSASDVLIWVGSFWFGFMLYCFLGMALVDLLKAVWSLGLASWVKNWDHKARVAVVIASLIVIGAGYLNALEPQVKTIRLHIPKVWFEKNELRVVAVSDIHLGTIVGRSRFQRIWEKVNALSPDLILLPGDILDSDPHAALKNEVGELLRSLKAKYGVFGITGNHEYIGGVEEAVSYLQDHGITLLRDAFLKIDGGLYLVGREDRSIKRFLGIERRPLGEIIKSIPPEAPIILMDHQPFDLHEAPAHGVDLQISGHTHHGQLWPLNLITNAVYELSWGYLKKGNTHIYVSCGAGTWGPPVRIGSSPEIVSFILTFGT